MCGIAGYYSTDKKFTEKDLTKMTDSLSHRGPDACGYFNDNNVGLGHKRLRIIDLSDAANQPMLSHSKRYVITFNGEIYNYKNIGKELNTNFRTSSDTEVILDAFEKWNINFVDKLNGMFAIAIYDKQEKKLYLFRDRMGIKPLFYFWDGKNFAFASELKALTKLNFIKTNKQINKQAINNFLYLGYIPEPDTIYQNIFKFPSAHYAIISNDLHNQIKINPYWKLEDKIRPVVINDFKKAKTQLNQLITKSVEYRLISDVPYGTFLSGGTDSSLITAIAQKLTNNKLKTFSIGFKEAKFDESVYAKKVAKYLNTEHHEFIVSYDQAIPLIDEILNSFDEPYADSSAIPTMLISKLAKQYVTVALSGEGGDELFYGYGSYKWANRLSNPLVKSFRKPIALALSHLSNKYQRASYLFKYTDKDQIKSHIFSQEQYFFTQNEINNLITNDFKTHNHLLEENFTYLKRKLNAAEAQALFDLKYYLKDDLLVKSDRASMKYSLETRVPFLDHNIIEFALNIPYNFKIKNGIQKYILKEVLYQYIPKHFFYRPKWGLAVPLSKWLKNELRYLIDDYLSEEIIKKYNIVNYDIVENLKTNYLYNNKDFLYNRLWSLIILHKFMCMND